MEAGSMHMHACGATTGAACACAMHACANAETADWVRCGGATAIATGGEDLRGVACGRGQTET